MTTSHTSGPVQCHNSLVRAAGWNLLLDLPVHGVRGRPPSSLSVHLQDDSLLALLLAGPLFPLWVVEQVFLLHLVGDGALLHATVSTRQGHVLFRVPGPLRYPVGADGYVRRRFRYPGMVVPFRDGPGLEILLVLGLAVERCFRFVVLVLGFTAGLGSHFPVLKVLAHYWAAHALLGDAPSRRACRCVGAGFGARGLRFYGDPGLGRVERRLKLDVLHLGDIRVLGEDQRHRNVSFVQLVPEAGHAARPADTGPRHAEVPKGPLQHNSRRLRYERRFFFTPSKSWQERNKMSAARTAAKPLTLDWLVKWTHCASLNMLTVLFSLKRKHPTSLSSASFRVRLVQSVLPHHSTAGHCEDKRPRPRSIPETQNELDEQNRFSLDRKWYDFRFWK